MDEEKLQDMRKRAELVRNATEPGENTAERVGGVLVDTVDAITDVYEDVGEAFAKYDSALSEKADREALNGYATNEALDEAKVWVYGSGWRGAMTRGCKESIGDDNTKGAIGDNAVATGVNTTAKGKFSHAEGNSTTAEGENSHAEGYNGVASGSCAHAEGGKTKATGANAHAEGSGTTAEGENSHAEGFNSKAMGHFSHAENGSLATGRWSHAEGSGSTASGDDSHAEGYYGMAYGDGSHAEGRFGMAYGVGSHAEGMCNHADRSFISSVGVGGGPEDAKRQNAISVYVGRSSGTPYADPTDPHNGHSYFLGIGGYKGQSVEEGMKSLQEVVAEFPTKAEVSASVAAKADLEDGNVPTAQLGNAAAIVDERMTLHVMSLPQAKNVEEGDTVLLMRQGEDGTKECLRVDRATLCKTPAKRVKRYVIGRAIAPKSCMDSGHENWYCFGTRASYNDAYLVMNVKEIRRLKLFVNGEEVPLVYDGDDVPFAASILHDDHGTPAYTRIYYVIKGGRNNVYAFKVISADERVEGGEEFLEMHLAMKYAPDTLSSESTHHSFVRGVRKWVGGYLPCDHVRLYGDTVGTFELRVGGLSRKVCTNEVYIFDMGQVQIQKWMSAPISFFSKKGMSHTGKRRKRYYKTDNEFTIPGIRDFAITGIFMLTELSRNGQRKGRSVVVHIAATLDKRDPDNVMYCLSLKKIAVIR